MAMRASVRVEGVVQGVGFRPFVQTLARRLELTGRVGNDGAGVFIEVEGPSSAVEKFLAALRAEAPPMAQIEKVTTVRRQRSAETDGDTDGADSTSAAAADAFDGFEIVPSTAGGPRSTLVSADSAVCADCLAELADPADRRYRYPFINCTGCGPRFTIVRDVPYDRPNTTMAAFPMCAACAREYRDPANRRFHAQPVCCPTCGPRLRLMDRERQPIRANEDPLSCAADLLRAGRVLAVKGLGGYHLAADAGSESAVAALRAGKHREDKPFALMVGTVDEARRLCVVDEAARRLLTSHRRPVVLMDRLAGAPVADAVAPGCRQLGIMLPYTPLHHLLVAQFGGLLVMTSGNVSDEPIAYRDDDAFHRLAGIAPAFLTHDRAIYVRTDDSVARTWRGRPMPVRRSRGYAPEPLTLPWRFPRPVLACGAELKNTFCVAKDDHAFCSHHIGDLENFETLRSFEEGIDHFCRLFGIDPAIVAHDLHPDYLSTKYALSRAGEADVVSVQHHHAHIASCLADNGEPGPALGVAFDGTGYGDDATIWGGEFLLADLVGYQRMGHLATVPLPGGAAAVKQPWRMAVAYLDRAFEGDPPTASAVLRRHELAWRQVAALGRAGVNSPLTSSAGRLFDAVAAVLGVRDEVNYEGQAAVELEQFADPGEGGAYPVTLEGGGAGEAAPLQVSGAALMRSIVSDLQSGVDPSAIATRFHNTVAVMIGTMCRELRERTGVTTVALSGGVFQNRLLLDRASDLLAADGFRVLTHTRVPCNDGGISLGQAAVAGALRRR
jgi:hydrogenase maturation protein HypF